MSYVEKTLLTGEQVLHRSHLHWKLFIGPAVLTLLLVVLVATTFGTDPTHVVAWISLLAAAAAWISAWVKRSSSEFVVTNKRVLIKMGVVSTTSLEILHQKIEAIVVNQGLLGKMLGYGTVAVRGTGGSQESFANIQDPLGFRRAVQEELARIAGA